MARFGVAARFAGVARFDAGFGVAARVVDADRVARVVVADFVGRFAADFAADFVARFAADFVARVVAAGAALRVVAAFFAAADVVAADFVARRGAAFVAAFFVAVFFVAALRVAGTALRVVAFLAAVAGLVVAAVLFAVEVAFFAAAVARFAVATAFVAVAFRAAVVFVAAVALLAVAVFLAVAVLVAVAVFFTAGSFFLPLTTSLKDWPGRNAGTEVFLSFTGSPVRGLRAVRAARGRFSNTPKPAREILPPFATVRWISARTASRAAVAFDLSPMRVVSASMSSALFTTTPVWLSAS